MSCCGDIRLCWMLCVRAHWAIGQCIIGVHYLSGHELANWAFCSSHCDGCPLWWKDMRGITPFCVYMQICCAWVERMVVCVWFVARQHCTNEFYACVVVGNDMFVRTRTSHLGILFESL